MYLYILYSIYFTIVSIETTSVLSPVVCPRLFWKFIMEITQKMEGELFLTKLGTNSIKISETRLFRHVSVYKTLINK